MQSLPARQPQQSCASRSFAWFADVRLLAILVLVGGAVHAWLIGHTVVLARDGVDFLHFEWRLEHDAWATVLRSEGQHPGYPLAVMALSTPLRHLLHRDDSNAMALYAQLTSALAACLLVIPMYYLGRELFNRRVAFWTALVFQCLPLSGRATSDALSEGLFLLLVACSLLLCARSLKSGSLWGFAMTGVCGGVAYLVRPEGVLVVMAAALAIASAQFMSAWRISWKQTGKRLATVCLAALGTGLPYAAAVGGFTVKPTAKEVIDAPPPPVTYAAPQDQTQKASLLGIWWSADPKHARPVQSLAAVGLEVGRGFYYVGWIAALYGLFRYRKRIPTTPAAWPVLLLCGLHAAAIWRVAAVKGYVSERHVLVILMCGLFWAVAALQDIAVRAADGVRLLAEKRPGALLAFGSRAWVWSVGLPLAFAGAALPRTLQPLHANEAGHRAAGRWLAAHARADDVICDPFKWAGYYAGRAFQEDWDPGRPLDTAQYVVLEPAREQHSKERVEEQARRIAARGQLVYEWRPDRRAARLKAGPVEIYRVSSEETSP